MFGVHGCLPESTEVVVELGSIRAHAFAIGFIRFEMIEYIWGIIVARPNEVLDLGLPRLFAFQNVLL